MEIESSVMPPKAPRLTVEEDALASQVLEIIGGISREALQTLEESEERDVWSMEEGDDSVFYSDDDQAHQEANTSCGFGANKSKPLVNSVATDEDDPWEESIIDEESLELAEEVTQHVILTDQEEERQEVKILKTEPMDQTDPADPGAQSKLTPEKSLSTCGEHLKRTIADMQTEQNISSEKANLPVEKEEVTPNLEPSDVTSEESNTRLNGEADVPEQMSNAELQISGDRQLQVQPKQEQNFHVPVGFYQNSSPGYSTLPLPKKSYGSDDHQKSFNHLSSSKYGTVSYRKIRKGNTRQKIEEFECMITNL
ncbi:ermin-like [Cottoperca gobio]|uniref:Ermin n=1 Tax=Cottoperca gobio TaxID=56716 RepID=A0A6J2RZ00_COTGO|nr:ermin-like [Cottoperca gobio]